MQLLTVSHLRVNGGQVYGTGDDAIFTDGVAFARVHGDLLQWTPALSCGVRQPEIRWGRYPTLFAFGRPGLIRFDERAGRWMEVPTNGLYWSPALIAEWPDQAHVLVAWHGQIDWERGGRSPVRPPGFYLVGTEVRSVDLELPPHLGETPARLAVSPRGDVIYASTTAIEIWPHGSRTGISRAIDAAYPTPQTGALFIDAADPTDIEVVYPTKSGSSAIVRFDGKRFFDVPTPFKDAITVWARTGEQRLYGTVKNSTSHVWSRGSDDTWTPLGELPGRVSSIARDDDGAVWARAGWSVWYLPKTGMRTQVLLPDPFSGSHLAGFFHTGSTAWIMAWGNKYRVFTSRPFRATGHRVLPGEDPCAPTTAYQY